MTGDSLVAATGCIPERAVAWAVPLTAAMAAYQINTPARQAAFLAQIAHESGKFHWLREIWGPTPAQRRYEGRRDLGNLSPGDGFKYRGRGLIQVTGKDNYRSVGAALHLDLLNNPDQLAEPENAARSAGWFWMTHGLNERADRGEFESITRRINGGLNGYSERCILWDQAKRALGVA